MAWIKLTDNYEDDHKIIRLSDGAFRLWHQIVSYCRRNPNDGLISKAAMLERKSYRPKRLDELMAFDPKFEDRPLVSKVDGFGFVLNAYLKWNPSKEEDAAEKAAARDRMRRVRTERSPEHYSERSPEHYSERSDHLAREVPVRRGRGTGISSEEEDLSERAAKLRQELYPAWFREHRGGFLPIVASPKEFGAAVELCKCFSDERLEDIAAVILTTDDPWISQTDRGFLVFAKKASWAEQRLRQAEGAS